MNGFLATIGFGALEGRTVTYEMIPNLPFSSFGETDCLLKINIFVFSSAPNLACKQDIIFKKVVRSLLGRIVQKSALI